MHLTNLSLRMQLYQKFLTILGLAGVAGVFGYGVSAWNRSSKIGLAKKPHIILIIADDMGWNDVSFHGADQIPTPNIDALAYNGVILNRHYVLPICTPSRTSLMTGRYPIREGMQGWPLKSGEPRGIPLNVTLMPEHMRRLGYETKLVGKWHVGYYTENHTPARRGFDTFFGYYNGFITYFNKTISQDLPDGTVTGNDLHRDGPKKLGIEFNDSEYFTDLITDEAERIIKDNGNDNPLFLEIAHLAVHASDSKVETLEVRNLAEVNKTFAYIKDSKRRKYAGMMKAMDESVGRVVKALSEAHMLENSIIVFMADNGAPTIDMYENAGSNYPLRGIKNTLFEGGVRGAACVFSPLIKAPSRLSEQYIHISDWLPTFYSAAGGNVADLGVIDGLDQWKSLVKGSTSPRQELLVNIDEVEHLEGAIIGRHKLVKGADNLGEGYYGESGNDPSYPTYSVEDALTSMAGQVISRLSGFISPSANKARKLRERATIHCDPVTRYANCSGTCLFDIINDPCETQDLSGRRPRVVRALESLINRYRRVLTPQTNADVDLCSLPQYFNNTWMPWRKDDAASSSIVPASTCQRSNKF